MKLTDKETGQEYEKWGTYNVPEGLILVKPITKKVEKKEYQVMLETLRLSQLIANERIGGQLRLTRKTAEALAEAIEAAIDYITGNKDALPVLVSLKAARGSYQDKEKV